MEFGKRLKIIRKRKRLTQLQLGVLIGLNSKSADIRISQYEIGSRVSKLTLINKISEVLNVPDYLLLSNHQDDMINIYIDLYWQLIEGKDITYITKLFEVARLIDNERFMQFEKIIK